METLKVIGIILAVLLVLLLGIAAFVPKTFVVERRLVINAPPQVVFNEVNSFKKWEPWSPWLAEDTTIVNTYTGPEAGPGNKVNWTSKESGNGSMEIIESTPPNSIRTTLVLSDFTPFYGHFTFSPVANGTEVIWTDSGSIAYPWNIFNLFADKMMGNDFEEGLANLEKHVKSLPADSLSTQH